MPQVADYKVVHEPTKTITTEGGTAVFTFSLPPAALLVDLGQRPFITFNLSADGAMPQTISITLNGTAVNTHTYPLPAQKAMRTVIIDGSTFSTDENTLVFTLTEGAGTGAWTVKVSDVIVHFQQAV